MTAIAEEERPSADSRAKAIICINLFSISITITSVIFKQVQQQGVSVIDYQFFRSFTILVLAAIALCIEQRNPVREFPSQFKWTLLTIIIFGLAAVFIFYAALALAPLIIINVIIKLDSFIVLVLGFLINREPFVLLEVLGMLICFGAILAMALSAAKESEASEEVRTE